jgi:hypothetical protein
MALKDVHAKVHQEVETMKISAIIPPGLRGKLYAAIDNFRYSKAPVRIPTKPATYSDTKPAAIPTRSRPFEGGPCGPFWLIS